MSAAVIHGVLLSIGLIMAFGAQNVFIFNQGASHKKLRSSLPAVITASVCDTILIILAVLGVSLMVMTVPGLQITLFAAGFLFLLYIGWTIWSSDPVKVNDKYGAMRADKQIMFAISVSLLNPHAILDTIGVIGANSLRYSGVAELVAFAVACIIVSWITFIMLAVIGRSIRSIDREGKIVMTINKVSALMIWGVASYIAYQLYMLV
ncbi:LysE/ArgO family amino acid transporter [Lacicoccus alkaliphilus]|uniref:L-lysine exporter family protein LysE/ArgO n=1 Tax=Lacicoccus alkaliphilus DSM 16010 TaxID=1123231 RepID=A0A1M7DSZ9_9BACL|nr:LysE family transporter [Salinicoccus alkaliphilus]SHL82547.1 L-lysine exporter family protein LysE/ArgO [Salinicoccus alkaliphilus DSM 16010]